MTKLIDADALLAKLYSNFECLSKAETISHIENAPTVQREGWISVPIEPTQEMCQAGQIKAREWNAFPLGIAPIYQSMISAAPKE